MYTVYTYYVCYTCLTFIVKSWIRHKTIRPKVPNSPGLSKKGRAPVAAGLFGVTQGHGESNGATPTICLNFRKQNWRWSKVPFISSFYIILMLQAQHLLDCENGCPHFSILTNGNMANSFQLPLARNQPGTYTMALSLDVTRCH